MTTIINRLPWCAAKRIGGLVFISVGRLRLSYCIVRRA